MDALIERLLGWITLHGVAGGAIVAALVAFTVFILTRVFEIFFRWSDQRAARKRAVVGLFTEVKYNVTSIETFLNGNPYPGLIQSSIRENENFRPLMIVDETTQFYDAIVASLPDIEPECLIRLSEFYSTIRKLQAIRGAFESAAFPTISANGRASTVDELWGACRQAEKAGSQAKYELELAYPRRWFARFRS
jgi:hypothetical protein